MPKKKKSKKSKTPKNANPQSSSEDAPEEPEEIIPQLVCALKDISYVLLILYSEEYQKKASENNGPTNIKLLYTCIGIGIEIFLTENKTPITLTDKDMQENINGYINSFKETDIYTYIKPYIEPYKKGGKEIKEGVKGLFLVIQSGLNFLELYSKNDGKSKKFSIKVLTFIGFIIKSLFLNIYNMPVLKFTGEFGKIFLNFFWPAPASKSCGGSPSYHPLALLNQFIGNNPCEDFEDEMTQMMCKQWAVINKTKFNETFKHLIDYNTEDRGIYFKEVMDITLTFLQSNDEDDFTPDELFESKIKELENLKMCLKDTSGTITTFTCDTSDEPINESTPVATPSITGGGPENDYLYGGFGQFSNINKELMYDKINYFTDIHSLKGIYMLHQYNSYINTN